MTSLDERIDEDQRRYMEAFKTKGHSPAMDDGEVDWFAYCPDGHNGLRCIICGFSDCVHCDPEGKRIDECTAITLTCVEVKP